MVRLVRACGSKLYSFQYLDFLLQVRLVRACGSKLKNRDGRNGGNIGQARKSLWIETFAKSNRLFPSLVRLVRACGSKPPYSLAMERIKTVRLVRACGSKRKYIFCPVLIRVGQARKSLWIETIWRESTWSSTHGQARKSLWIETMHTFSSSSFPMVRLVRACGSKPSRSSYSQSDMWSGS